MLISHLNAVLQTNINDFLDLGIILFSNIANMSF